ncbi:MAG: putative DNA-binding domain-containing protein [Deltaproteobacteria bacterium]|nr:putative DNA-binding domain-containing protein [Nannocystaceae bacterium]
MLSGARSAARVEHALGASPSGTAALAFYAELVTRNMHKIMRDVFPCVRALACRDGISQWPSMVDAYIGQRPPAGVDPNGLAAGFPAWLSSRGVHEAEWAEIADFEWLRVLAHHAADGEPSDDGFERRLFVRRYSFDAPGFVSALTRDPAAARPPERACIVIVFRHHHTLRVAVHRPGAFGLAALARRQRLPLPRELAALDHARIDDAERVLIAAGVLVPLLSDPIHRTATQ